MTATIELPVWATEMDDLDRDGQVFTWFSATTAVAVAAMDGGRDAHDVGVHLWRTDECGEVGPVKVQVADETYSVAEARKLAEAILEMCDKAR